MKAHKAFEKITLFVVSAIRGGAVDAEEFPDLQEAHDVVHDIMVNHFGDSPDEELPPLTRSQEESLRDLFDRSRALGTDGDLRATVAHMQRELSLACRHMTPAAVDCFMEVAREMPAAPDNTRTLEVTRDPGGQFLYQVVDARGPLCEPQYGTRDFGSTVRGARDRFRFDRVSVPGLPDHLQRVVDEKLALDERLDKLNAFIDGSPVFKTLPFEEADRLRSQCNHMYAYSATLGARIAAAWGAR